MSFEETRLLFQSASRTKNRGFTLLEIVMVLMMIGILGAVSFSNFSIPETQSAQTPPAALIVRINHVRKQAVLHAEERSVLLQGTTLTYGENTQPMAGDAVSVDFSAPVSTTTITFNSYGLLTEENLTFTYGTKSFSINANGVIEESH